MQRDPLGYIDGMNLFEYVGSNGVNRVDPLGLLSKPIIVDLSPYIRYEKGRVALTGRRWTSPMLKKSCCYIIWIHGFNTNLTGARGRFHQAHKELSMIKNKKLKKCEFIGVHWRGYTGGKLNSGLNFNLIREGAVHSAKFLKKLTGEIKTLCPMSKLHIFAHSLGNEVALSSVSKFGNKDISSLSMYNAAVETGALFRHGRHASAIIDIPKIKNFYNSTDLTLVGFKEITGTAALGSQGQNWGGYLNPIVAI